jgi:hypothetical protein
MEVGRGPRLLQSMMRSRVRGPGTTARLKMTERKTRRDRACSRTREDEALAQNHKPETQSDFGPAPGNLRSRAVALRMYLYIKMLRLAP